MKHPLTIALTMTTASYSCDPQSLLQEPKTTPKKSTALLSMDSLTPLTPDDILADGQDSLTMGDRVVVRKGTVKATMENVNRLNKLFLFPFSSERSQKVNQIVDVMDTLIPSLHYIGMFDFFSPFEWMQNDNDQGKILIAILYLKQHRNQLTYPLEQRLRDVKLTCPPEVKEHIEALAKGEL